MVVAFAVTMTVQMVCYHLAGGGVAVDSGVVAEHLNSILSLLSAFGAVTLILAFGSSELCARSTHVPKFVYDIRAHRAVVIITILYTRTIISLTSLSSSPYDRTRYY